MSEDSTDIEARSPAEPPAERPPDIEARYSPLSQATREALNEPLDRSRVKERSGRGGGKFSYIEAHDAIRTANRLFGFGNWGYEIVAQERIGEVEVVSRNNKPGFHVAYRCQVRLTVRGCIPITGTGYGDGVEYGGVVAKLTASELAIKESEADAMKRALMKWGDQFGLILYAKGDDQATIEREENRDQVQWTRSDPENPIPRNWADWVERFAKLTGGTNVADLEQAKEWLREAVTITWGIPSIADLKQSERREAFIWANATLLKLEETHGDLAFTTGLRDIIRAGFSEFWKGIALDGPPWRLGPDEPDRPSYEEWLETASGEPLASKKAPEGEEPTPEPAAAEEPA